LKSLRRKRFCLLAWPRISWDQGKWCCRELPFGSPCSALSPADRCTLGPTTNGGGAWGRSVLGRHQRCAVGMSWHKVLWAPLEKPKGQWEDMQYGRSRLLEAVGASTLAFAEVLARALSVSVLPKSIGISGQNCPVL